MIAVLLFLAQLAPVAEEPKPVATTIAAIVANPAKFDGQVVRITGWVNSCGPASCPVSERAATAPGGPGASLSVADDKKFDSVVRPLAPTYVELDARVDSTCIANPKCPDQKPALTIVTLRGVVSPEPPPFEN